MIEMRKRSLMIVIGIAIASVAVAIAVIVAGIVLAPNGNEVNVNALNTELSDNGRQENAHGSSSTSMNVSLGDGKNDNDTVNGHSAGDAETDDTTNQSTPSDDNDASDDNEPLNISGSGRGMNASIYSSPGLDDWQKRFLRNIDVDKTAETAKEFVGIFMNFDSDNLGDGSWRRNLSSYVDVQMMEDLDDEDLENNLLWKYYSDPQWAINCSTYKEYQNKILSIDSIKMTAAYTRDGSQIVPVAIVETTEESNAIDRPSISDDWKSINKVKKQYQVQFTPNGSLIFNVVLADQNVLEYDITGIDQHDDSVSAQ